MIERDIGKLRQAALEAFAAAMGRGDPPRTAVAPGRVNLIGEHTDYNDGFVLPMAIDVYTAVAAAPRADSTLRAHSVQFGETFECRLSELAPLRRSGWRAYVEGVVWSLATEGLDTGGMDVLIDGRVPIGAGVSSSAALELALARVSFALAGEEWNAPEAVRLARRADNEYVGIPSGIMDQSAVALSREGEALLLDCRSLDVERVRIPDAATVVVLDTGVRRALAASAYAERVAECQRALAAVRRRHPLARSLRDVDETVLADAGDDMDDVARARATHVIAESRRPGELARAFASGDMQRAGELLRDSHTSLRDLYEVSSEELDWMVECAGQSAGCHGARMMGGGFGGSCVALVQRGAEEEFIRTTLEGYSARFAHPAHPAHLFAVRPVGGARLI